MSLDVVPTMIRVEPSGSRVRVDLRSGVLIPRLVHAGERDCVVALIAGGALLLAGDHVHIEVEVGAGCRLRIEDVGGTVAYGGKDRESGWHVSVRVREGGRLRWDALPFVVGAGANVHRTTDVELEVGAVAQLRETLVLGRHGEAGGRIRTSTSISIEGVALLREELDIDGTAPLPGILGRHRVLDTALMVGRRATASQDGAAMQLDGPGTIVRALGNDTHLATIDAAWAAWRDESTTTEDQQFQLAHP